MKLIRLSENQATTLKRFLFEITTIIVGVLIALSFDGIADWRRNQQLVREAKANLRTELRDNREAVAGFLKGVEEKRKISRVGAASSWKKAKR